eukprot:15431328-Alexandrium_andersonii.AAC.1
MASPTSRPRCAQGVRSATSRGDAQRSRTLCSMGAGASPRRWPATSSWGWRRWLPRSSPTHWLGAVK